MTNQPPPTRRKRQFPKNLLIGGGCAIVLALLGFSAFYDRSSPNARIFRDIYKNKVWGVNERGEGHSGSGSKLETTVVYRAFLQDYLAKNNIRSVVDAGCGDWECSRAIDWTGIDYRGYDIVEDVIQKNRKRYGADNIQFFVADIIRDPLPPADLLICKHVLQHLPNEEILAFLVTLPRYKKILLINSVDPRSLSAPNDDIRIGAYRPLDLTRQPFNLSGMLVLTYWDGNHMHQVLAVEGRE